MKVLKQFLLINLILPVLSLLTLGSDLYTADISYSCSGINTYDFRVTLYRDCASGGSAPNSITLEFNSESCASSFTSTLTKTLNTKEDTLVCDNDVLNTYCNGGNLHGIMEHYYTGSVIFPSQCPDWEVTYNHAGRNVKLTTIQNPASEGLQIKRIIDNTTPPCNNASSFTFMPVMQACAGQPFCYNIGAYDNDGDSLVVRLTSALDTSGEVVDYKQGYNMEQPISTLSNNPFSLNQQTNEVCFTPDTPQTGIVAFKVYAYRGDQLVSVAQHELFLMIDSCAHNQPSVDSPFIQNTSNAVRVDSKTMETCVGSNMSFEIPASDSDGHNIKMTANNNQRIPGSNFSVSCSSCPNPVGTFDWSPSATGDYSFTVRLEDDTCAIPGYNFYTYKIKVLDGTTIRSKRSAYCSGSDSIQLRAYGGTSFVWSPDTGLTCDSCRAPKAAPTQPQQYTVTSNFICNNTATIFIDTVPTFNVTAQPDTFLCNEGDSAQLTTTVSSSTPNSYSYEWSPTLGLSNASVANPKASPPPPRAIDYVVTVTSDSGCVQQDTVRVSASNIPLVGIDATKEEICMGDTLQVMAGAFQPGDTLQDDFDPDYDTTVWASVNNGTPSTLCCSIDSNALRFHSTGTRSAITKPANVLAGGVISFYLKYGKSNCSDCETLDSFDEVEFMYSTDGGNSWVTLSTYDNNQYSNYTKVTETIPPAAKTATTQFKWEQPNHSGNGFDHWAIDLVKIPTSQLDTTATYNWSPGFATADSSSDTTQAFPKANTSFNVTVNSQGCKASKTISVMVDSSRVKIQTPDTTICRRDSTTLNASVLYMDSIHCSLFYEDFDPGVDSSLWAQYNGVQLTTDCNKSAPNALMFQSSSGDRYITTNEVDVSTGGVVTFALREGAGNCGEDPNTGEDLTLQYSIDDGNNWIDINTYSTANGFININEPIPTSAETDSTQFRFIQTTFGSNIDNWIIDNVGIAPTNLNRCFHWTPDIAISDTNSATTTVAPYNDVTYQVRYSGTICFPTDTVRVRTKGPRASRDTTMDATCGKNNAQAAVSVSDGASPYSYLWSDSAQQTSATATGLKPGTYTVTVTDDDGCTDTHQVALGRIPAPVVQIKSVQDASCFNKSDGSADITVSSGSPPYNYSWSNGAQTQDLTNVIASTYFVTVTDNEGCTIVKSFKISQPDRIQPSIFSKGLSSASANDGMAWVNVSGGILPYTYQWNDPNNSTTDTITNLPAGNYTVTITDAKNCQATASVKVPVGTGIQGQAERTSLSVYPNPTNGQITVNINTTQHTNIALSVYNMVGEKVLNHSQDDTNKIDKKLDLHTNAPGLYFLKVSVGSKLYVRKIILE